MIDRIVVHPGGAHKDDFLACALLISRFPVAISRREPTVEDLANSRTAVVDVGGEWDPEKMNFDHHQFPRDSEPLCALSLVLKYLGLYEDAQQFCDWLEVAEWIDTRGLIATAKWLGVDREVAAKLNSPVDVTLLRRFAASTEHRPGEPIWEVMKMVGDDLIQFVTGMRERLAYIDEHCEIIEMDFGMKVILMPRTLPMPSEPSAGLGRYIEEKGLENEVVGMIYPDRRGEGYGLSRYNDDLRLEFTRLEDEPDIHFAHAKGFLAKTSATQRDRLLDLVHQAWVEERS